MADPKNPQEGAPECCDNMATADGRREVQDQTGAIGQVLQECSDGIQKCGISEGRCEQIDGNCNASIDDSYLCGAAPDEEPKR